MVGYLAAFAFVALLALVGSLIYASAHWLWWTPPAVMSGIVLFWYAKLRWSQFKYFSPDENKPLKLRNLRDWPQIWNMTPCSLEPRNYDSGWTPM